MISVIPRLNLFSAHPGDVGGLPFASSGVTAAFAWLLLKVDTALSPCTCRRLYLPFYNAEKQYFFTAKKDRPGILPACLL